MFYESIFVMLYKFANYEVFGVLLCRLLAPVVLVALLWISRIVNNVLIKVFSVFIALILYFFPNIINNFVG